MLEQCCNHLKQCCNNAVMLCCAKNRCYESSRVTSLLSDNETQFNWNKTWLRIPKGWRLITVEISGRMRDMSKKVFKRKLISVLFEILKGKDDYLGATMITREIKSRNPKPWPLSQVVLNRFVFLAFEFITHISSFLFLCFLLIICNI